MLSSLPAFLFRSPWDRDLSGGGTLSVSISVSMISVENLLCEESRRSPGLRAAGVTPPRPLPRDLESEDFWEDVFPGFFWTSFFSWERRGDGALVDCVLDEEDTFLDADEGRLLEVEESSMSLGRSQTDSPLQLCISTFSFLFDFFSHFFCVMIVSSVGKIELTEYWFWKILVFLELIFYR